MALCDYDRAMQAVRNDRVAPLDAAARLRGAVIDFAAACLANDVALAGKIATTIAYGWAIANEATAEDIAGKLADMASEHFDMSDETSREEYLTLEAVVTSAVVQACKLITLTALAGEGRKRRGGSRANKPCFPFLLCICVGMFVAI